MKKNKYILYIMLFAAVSMNAQALGMNQWVRRARLAAGAVLLAPPTLLPLLIGSRDYWQYAQGNALNTTSFGQSVHLEADPSHLPVIIGYFALGLYFCCTARR